MRASWIVRMLLVVSLATLLVAAGCGGGGGDDQSTEMASGDVSPRNFLMGVSALPPESGDEAYRNAFKLAGDAGDVILIQRAPPWSEFLPGASISGRTEQLTRLEKDLAKSNDLKLFLAVDPTDPADRGMLANLPDDLRGADFSDARVRGAFIAYSKYLALNYKPAYMALGVEVDMIFHRRGDAAFRNFQSLYFEAYDAVKSVSSDTLVFPTFLYEDMLGKLSGDQARQPSWSLIDRFSAKMDMLGISTFPGFAYQSFTSLPTDYYSTLRGKANVPLAFVSVGWTTETRQGQTLAAAEAEQEAYLRRFIAQAQGLQAEVCIWYLARDPLTAPSANFGPLASMGLWTPDGRPKTAWNEWLFWVNRPLAKSQ